MADDSRGLQVEDQAWRSYVDIAEVFRGPADAEWEADRDRIDQRPRDPWADE